MATATIANNASLVIEPFIFPRGNWEIRGEWPNTAIKGVPGEWLERANDWPRQILAIICCPKCLHNVALIRNVHTIDKVGHVKPSFQHQGCDFHRDIYLDDWNKMPLYACAILRHGKSGKVKAEIIYTHAKTQQEARLQLGPGNYTITAIGRAIGFFVEDKHGLKLSAD